MYDKLLVLSDKQEVTSSSFASENYIDASAVSNTAHPFYCEVIVNEDIKSGGELLVAVVGGKDETFEDTITLAVSSNAMDFMRGAVVGDSATTTISAGTQILVPVPYNFNTGYPYIRAQYVTLGSSPSGGSITSTLTPYAFTNHK